MGNNSHVAVPHACSFLRIKHVYEFQTPKSLVSAYKRNISRLGTLEIQTAFLGRIADTHLPDGISALDRGCRRARGFSGGCACPHHGKNYTCKWLLCRGTLCMAGSMTWSLKSCCRHRLPGWRPIPFGPCRCAIDAGHGMTDMRCFRPPPDPLK